MNFLLLAVEQSTVVDSAAGVTVAALSATLALLRRRRAKTLAIDRTRRAAEAAALATTERIAVLVREMHRHGYMHPVRYSPEQLVTATLQRVKRAAQEEGFAVPIDLEQRVREGLRHG